MTLLGLLLFSSLSPSSIDESLRAHLELLAGEATRGRQTGTEGGLAATAYVARSFEEAGLETLGDGPDTYFQRIPGEAEIPSRNAIGRVPGSGSSDEPILVTAHVDHLGERAGVVFPGANTNASGVAVLLELADRFAERPARRDIVFAVLDADEVARRGSSHLMRFPPVPLDRIAAVVSIESVGHGYLGLLSEHLFALGGEAGPEVGELIEGVDGRSDLEILRLSRELLGPPPASEPFLQIDAPYLVLTGGPHPASHTPSDRASAIDLERLRAVTRTSEELVRALAELPVRLTRGAVETLVPSAGLPAEDGAAREARAVRAEARRAAWAIERSELAELKAVMEGLRDRRDLSPPMRERVERVLAGLTDLESDPAAARESQVDRLRTLLRSGHRLASGSGR